MVNKTDLAEAVGADLDRMKSEAKMMRGDGPVVMAHVRGRKETSSRRMGTAPSSSSLQALRAG